MANSAQKDTDFREKFEKEILSSLLKTNSYERFKVNFNYVFTVEITQKKSERFGIEDFKSNVYVNFWSKNTDAMEFGQRSKLEIVIENAPGYAITKKSSSTIPSGKKELAPNPRLFSEDDTYINIKPAMITISSVRYSSSSRPSYFHLITPADSFDEFNGLAAKRLSNSELWEKTRKGIDTKLLEYFGLNSSNITNKLD